MIYLPDSDILNYVIKGIQPAKERILAATRGGATFVLSQVVHYEITRYHLLRRAARLQRVYRDLTADWQRVELEGADWDQATDLWVARHRAGRPIGDADLLIAVTALKSGAVLVTNNTRHFEGLGLAMETGWLRLEAERGSPGRLQPAASFCLSVSRLSFGSPAGRRARMWRREATRTPSRPPCGPT